MYARKKSGYVGPVRLGRCIQLRFFRVQIEPYGVGTFCQSLMQFF